MDEKRWEREAIWLVKEQSVEGSLARLKVCTWHPITFGDKDKGVKGEKATN